MPTRTTLPSALHITRWFDPLVDERGHIAECPFVESYWLPTLGPTATLLIRRLAVYLDDWPDGFDIPLEELSRQLGLGLSAGRHSPLPRAIDRCVRFGVAKRVGPNRLAVRRVIGLLSEHQIDGLTPFLQSTYALDRDNTCQALDSL